VGIGAGRAAGRARGQQRGGGGLVGGISRGAAGREAGHAAGEQCFHHAPQQLRPQRPRSRRHARIRDAAQWPRDPDSFPDANTARRTHSAHRAGSSEAHGSPQSKRRRGDRGQQHYQTRVGRCGTATPVSPTSPHNPTSPWNARAGERYHEAEGFPTTDAGIRNAIQNAEYQRKWRRKNPSDRPAANSAVWWLARAEWWLPQHALELQRMLGWRKAADGRNGHGGLHSRCG
jgi:hypothetical protein